MADDADVKETMDCTLREAGAELFKVSNQKIGVGLWHRAVMDCRFGPEQPTSLSKAAAYLSDGTRQSLKGAADALFVIRRAHKLVRDDESAKDIRWYGIILTALPDGSCSWELNPDPNCVEGFDTKW